MKPTKPAKPYWEMNLQELEEATKQFDRPFVIDEFKPLTPAMRRRWERAKRKPGRPRIGKGAQVISVPVEKELLEQTNKLAKKLGLSRAALIARGLRHVLAQEQPPRPTTPRRKTA